MSGKNCRIADKCTILEGYSHYNDQQLLLAIQQDDDKAFAELFRRHWKAVHELAYSKVRSGEVTADIVQDLFITLWDKRHSLVIHNLPAYLATSVKNRVLNYIKSMLVHRKYWKYYSEFLPQHEYTTDNAVEYANLRKAIEHGLRGLPEKSGIVFRLNHLDGLSIAEIASRLNLSEKAIQYHITQSLKHLRIFLKSYLLFFMITCGLVIA